MREISAHEFNTVHGGLSPEQGVIMEGAIASAAFAVGMTGVGLIATAAVLLCAAMMDD